MPGVQLLVSIRNAAEAVAALAGGADLIDVKEPSRGPLGRADAETIAAVVQEVGGRVPVSAALGELRDNPPGGASDLPASVQYVKWGLCGLGRECWVDKLRAARRATVGRCVVAVAYADAVRAGSPPAAEVVAFAVAEQMSPVLFDTFGKDGSGLLDWLSADEITSLVADCRGAGDKVALAGSLDADAIRRLGHLRPDWFAVRGAVCDGGRGGTVSEKKVRELAEFVHSL